MTYRDGMKQGREAKEGENVYIIMADLHCCMVETNTTLQQLKMFKFKNRKKLHDVCCLLTKE